MAACLSIWGSLTLVPACGAGRMQSLENKPKCATEWSRVLTRLRGWQLFQLGTSELETRSTYTKGSVSLCICLKKKKKTLKVICHITAVQKQEIYLFVFQLLSSSTATKMLYWFKPKFSRRCLGSSGHCNKMWVSGTRLHGCSWECRTLVFPTSLKAMTHMEKKIREKK